VKTSEPERWYINEFVRHGECDTKPAINYLPNPRAPQPLG